MPTSEGEIVEDVHIQEEDPVFAYLCEIIVEILYIEPFYGRILQNIRLIDATDTDWCNTMATEGINIYYDRNFVLDQPDRDETIFVTRHELEHILHGDVFRYGHRDPKFFNIALDYVRNYTLVKQKVGKMPANALYKAEFTDDMLPEEVYEIIYADKEQYAGFASHADHLPAGSANAPGERQDDRDGSSATTLPGQSGEGSEGLPKPSLSPSGAEGAQRSIRNAILQAALIEQQAGRDIPDSMKHLIDQIVNPVMNWRALLATFEKSQIKSNPTYSRPSRRALGLYAVTGEYIPIATSDYDMTIELTVGLDVSGSLDNNMLRDLFSEIVSITRTFKDCSITVFCFDDYVRHIEHYTARNLEEIVDYAIPEHGGGTNFESIWKWLRATETVPKRLAIFTDGKPNGGWGEEDYCPTLFLIHSDPGCRIKPPFGDVAYYLPD